MYMSVLCLCVAMAVAMPMEIFRQRPRLGSTMED